MSWDLNDYVDVAERIRIAKEIYPDFSLQSSYEIIIVEGQTWIVVKSYAYRSANDDHPGVGHAWEIYPGKTPYTKGSELQNAETSSWGRSLAALGIEVRKVASKQEVESAKARQDNVPPSQRVVQAPREGEPVRGTYTVIKDPGGAPSEKQTMALSNKTIKLGINSDFHQEFWKFAVGRAKTMGDITKGEASKLIGMDKDDFEGLANAFMASLLETDAPF